MANGFPSLFGTFGSLLIQTVSGLTALRPRVLKIGSNLALADNADGTATLSATAAGLEVKEADGSPDVSGVTTLVVSNGTLTDDGGGQVTLTTGGGVGGTVDTFDVTVANQTGGDIPTGRVVLYVDAPGTGGLVGIPKVRLATTADTPGGIEGPFAVTLADIPNTTSGQARAIGVVDSLDTSGFSLGDDLYVGASGALSNALGNVWVGTVLTVNATTGTIFVGLGLASLAFPAVHNHDGQVGDGGSLSGISVKERSAPGTPAATTQTLYIDSTTHHLTRKDSSAAVVDLEPDITVKAPIASPTFTGITTAPEFSASGLTGATAASRYVGATASGAPVSGTFAVGDWISDQTGIRWTCTTAGTPGTWAQEPGTGGGGGLYSAYLCYQDQKAAGTNGGTFTNGAWRTRDITTEVVDTGNNGSVAANQITLAAGTYDCQIQCPATTCDTHAARLQDVTNVVTLLSGSSEYAGVAATTRSWIVGRFTLSGTTTLEVQHQCLTTKATTGFGQAELFTVAIEIYTIAQFWKV